MKSSILPPKVLKSKGGGLNVWMRHRKKKHEINESAKLIFNEVQSLGKIPLKFI